jgi:simple sugar transport system permease protein
MRRPRAARRPQAAWSERTGFLRSGFLRGFGNERWQWVSIPLLAIVVALAAIAVVVGAMGVNPLQVFLAFLRGAGWVPKPTYAGGAGMLTDLFRTLSAFTPMLFAALAVTVAFRGGLFNIGISGQMLAAGFLASIIVGYSGLTAWLAKPLVLLIGLVAGALVGALIGFLKYRFNINEVVSSIMVNYIVQYLVSYFIKTRFMDPVSRQSRAVRPASQLVFAKVKVGDIEVGIPIAFLLALLVGVALQVVLTKTAFGFEIQAVGANRRAAEYSGIGVHRTIFLTMTLSGALAGLAGVSYYLGYLQSIQTDTLAGMGFESIATALLGNAHPLGNIASAMLITTLDTGATYMSSTAGVRVEIAQLVTGLILLFSACAGFFRWWLASARARAEQDEQPVVAG